MKIEIVVDSSRENCLYMDIRSVKDIVYWGILLFI